uniref:Uncharacterized protein n=1 Tax=Glossina pallidipes TaxID=7398 RepID=A0A1B0A1H4_GLOPL
MFSFRGWDCLNELREEFLPPQVQAAVDCRNNRVSQYYGDPDIIISGLAAQHVNFPVHVNKIAGCLNVNISNTDINYCTYLNKKKNIMVKFKSVVPKDLLWKDSFTVCTTILLDFIGGEISSRI